LVTKQLLTTKKEQLEHALDYAQRNGHYGYIEKFESQIKLLKELLGYYEEEK
jgi:hypothetical protein